MGDRNDAGVAEAIEATIVRGIDTRSADDRAEGHLPCFIEGGDFEACEDPRPTGGSVAPAGDRNGAGVTEEVEAVVVGGINPGAAEGGVERRLPRIIEDEVGVEG